MVAVGLVGGVGMEGECEKVKAFIPLAQSSICPLRGSVKEQHDLISSPQEIQFEMNSRRPTNVIVITMEGFSPLSNIKPLTCSGFLN